MHVVWRIYCGVRAARLAHANQEYLPGMEWVGHVQDRLMFIIEDEELQEGLQWPGDDIAHPLLDALTELYDSIGAAQPSSSARG